jgi:hypothetical protein
MRVIGIDPSMTATGLCRWDGTTSTVKAAAKQKDNRLRVIREAVATVARVRAPFGGPVDLAVVELPPPGLKGVSIPALHMVQAAVRMALMDAGVPYAVVNPQYVKAYAGWAKNDKEAMARAAYEMAGVEFADDNQCDAWWLRQMALDRYGMVPLGSVRVAASQRAWLDKVVWPDIDTGAEL